MENFVFKKKFGQNFISDNNLLSAIVSDAKIEKNDNVLEIGAGAGSLTQELSSRAKKVISFEIDADLRGTLSALNLPNVEFVFEDFMKISAEEVEKKFSGEKFKVVANLPYYITTPIIFKLLEECKNLQSLTIMVQKEVAERVCAQAGGKDYGILSVMVAFYGNAKITRNISRQMFFPQPNVDSALLHIEIENSHHADQKKFLKFIKTCFSMRRKTLLNNLSPAFSKEELKTLLGEETLKRRAETFSLDEFLQMFEKLENKKEKEVKKDKTIHQIIDECLDLISDDLKTLKYIDCVDFLDIFPRSPEHKKKLDDEAIQIAKVIEKTERGNFYVFHTPIKTKFGELKIIKIRKYDETRLPWVAAPDFRVLDYQAFLDKYKKDSRFNYIEKPTYKGLEFKTSNSLIYFLDEPTTEYYKIK